MKSKDNVHKLLLNLKKKKMSSVEGNYLPFDRTT